MPNCAELADFYLPTKGDLGSNLEKRKKRKMPMKSKKLPWPQRRDSHARSSLTSSHHHHQPNSHKSLSLFDFLSANTTQQYYTVNTSPNTSKIKGDRAYKKKKDKRWIAMRNIWEQHSKNKNKKETIRKTLFPSITDLYRQQQQQHRS